MNNVLFHAFSTRFNNKNDEYYSANENDIENKIKLLKISQDTQMGTHKGLKNPTYR